MRSGCNRTLDLHEKTAPQRDPNAKKGRFWEGDFYFPEKCF
jgi:hypothetical protein